MAKAIRGHNLGTMVATALLLAALLLLVAAVFAVRMVSTTGDRVEGPAVGADRSGGSSITRDPYVDNHAGVVNRYRNSADTPAMSQDSAGGSSLSRDPAIERHAEIIARFEQDNPR